MATHDVTLEWNDGRTRDLAVAADETVLEAAEDAGIALPFGCLTGACATCTGRLLSGAPDAGAAFDYRRPPRALKDRHREAGYVLLCVATPRTDCRVAVGTDRQAELVDDPWK
jgi:ferredoxin